MVQVKAAGICGTDFHIFREGRADVELPRVMGHELAGIVVETGEDAAGLKPGDRVVMDPVISCGHCRRVSGLYYSGCQKAVCISGRSEF